MTLLYFFRIEKVTSSSEIKSVEEMNMDIKCIPAACCVG